jgi:hypothetical protein
MSAAHQGGRDPEEAGSNMIGMAEAPAESVPPPVEAQDETVAATAIARNDLEQEMRDQIVAEAVEAEVIKSGSSPAHESRKWMTPGCAILLLVIVGAVVVVVVAAGDAGGGNAPAGGGNAPAAPQLTEGPPTLDCLKSQFPEL